MKTNHTKKSTQKRTLVIAGIIFVALCGATAGYALLAQQNGWPLPFFNTSNESPQTTTERPVIDVDYSGPTKEDVDESQAAKEKIDQEQADDNSTQTPAQQQTVSVAVSFADVSGTNFEVRAFVPTAIEGGGTCTATLTQGSSKVQKSSEAFVDTSSSQCRPIYIPVSEFPSKGTWSLNITYASPTHKGESGAFEVSL